MKKLKDFLQTLEKFRKPPSDDPYDNRVTHCYLSFVDKDGREHFFEVRGWSKINKEKILNISVVNWTLCAGTAVIYMKEEIVDNYRILEKIY